MAGRHRAQQPRRWPRYLALVSSLGAAVSAAALGVVATDADLLRIAVLLALVAAFAPTLLPTLEQRHPTDVDQELRSLRLELARLAGELAAQVAISRAMPAQAPKPSPNLPLIRAALAAPAPVPRSQPNGHAVNGWPTVIDLTQESATTRRAGP